LGYVFAGQLIIVTTIEQNIALKCNTQLSDGWCKLCSQKQHRRAATQGLCCCQQHSTAKLLIYHCLQFKLSCSCDEGNTDQVSPSATFSHIRIQGSTAVYRNQHKRCVKHALTCRLHATDFVEKIQTPFTSVCLSVSSFALCGIPYIYIQNEYKSAA
jgi:hypothetical protein